MAWKATCGSFEQAWIAMSPPVRVGSRISRGSAGRRLQRCGTAWREPEPAVEEAGPEPDRHRQARRGQPDRLPGVGGRHLRRRRVARHGGAARHRLGRGGPGLQQRDEVGPLGGGDVERREGQAVLRVGADARPGALPGTRRCPTSSRWPGRSPPWPGRRPAATLPSPMPPQEPSARERRHHDHLRRHLRERLGQCVHRLRENLALRLAHRRVVDVAVALGELGETRGDVGEPGVELLGQRCVLARKRGLEQLEGLLGARDVGREVRQVGVGVAVLLAGDLRGGDLGEQVAGAVGQLGGLVGVGGHLRLQGGDVGVELVGDRRHPGQRVVDPERLLDAVEAGPLRRVGYVVDAGVDVRVEVAEALRDRLDRPRSARAPARTASWPWRCPRRGRRR